MNEVDPDRATLRRPTRWLRVSDLVTNKNSKTPGRFPISRSSFYGLKNFPKPVYLSPGTPVWDSEEVDAWEAALREQPVVPSRGGDRRKRAADEASK